MNRRPSWVEYFMTIAEVVSTRSTCLRRQIGAVATREDRILATGYNGAPTGIKHCIDLGGCMRETQGIASGTRQEKCRAIHAEENVFVQAAIHGIILKGCDFYCTVQPCVMCMRKIISLKPRNLYYIGTYPDQEAMEMLSEVAYQAVNCTNLSSLSHWRFTNNVEI